MIHHDLRSELVTASGHLNRLVTNYHGVAGVSNGPVNAALHQAINGIEAIQSPFDTIGMTSALGRTGDALTSKEIPETIPGLIGWFDVSVQDTLTLGSGDEILEIGNRVNGGGPVISGASGGPTYIASDPTIGSRPSARWPDVANQKSLALAADAGVSELFMVMQFQDGTPLTFDSWISIFGCDINPDSTRVIVRQGTGSLYKYSYLTEVEINGVRKGNADSILPMPLSVLRFSGGFKGYNNGPAPGSIPIRFVGDTAQNEAWRGPICEIIAYSDQVTLTPQQVSDVQNYLTQKWGITP